MSETAIKPRPRGRLTAAAVLLNVALFGVGVYFEFHPRDRHDVWSAAAVAGVAIVNSAALTLVPNAYLSPRFLPRLRRIALIANSLLLAVAIVIVVFEAYVAPTQAMLHGMALVVPPLLTITALRRQDASR